MSDLTYVELETNDVEALGGIAEVQKSIANQADAAREAAAEAKRKVVENQLNSLVNKLSDADQAIALALIDKIEADPALLAQLAPIVGGSGN